MANMPKFSWNTKPRSTVCALLATFALSLQASGSSASVLPRGILRLKGGEMLANGMAFSGRSFPSLFPSSSSLKSWRQKLQVDKQLEDDSAALTGVVERSIVIDAPAEHCFRVASGFDDYTKWAGCNYIRVLKTGRDGMGSVVQMKVGMFGKYLDYTLAYKYQRPRRMDWHAVSGSVKSLVGTYEFVPLGPSQTKVIYKLNVDPGFWLPETLRTATQKAVAGAALNELKRYTELPSTRAALLQGYGHARRDCGNDDQLESTRQRVYMMTMGCV